MDDRPPVRRTSFEDLSDLELERATKVSAGGRTAILITGTVVLFAGAVFALLSVVLVAEFSTSVSGAAVGFLLAYGILQAIAGVLVLLLLPAGRWLGIFLGVAGLGLGVALASSAPASGLVSILLSGFVIYALASSGPSFRRG